MGPKQPFIKFKPKSDTRAAAVAVKEEPVDEAVSAFQVERLRQVEAAAAERAAFATLGSVGVPQNAPGAAASASEPAKARGEASAQSGATALDRVRGGRGSAAIDSGVPGSSRGGRVLQQRGGRGGPSASVVFAAPAETKLEALPDVSIHDVMEDDSSSAFRPITLRGAPGRGVDGEVVRGRDLHVDSSSKDEARAGGDDAADTGADGGRGSAFLREHRRETEAANSANVEFFSNADGFMWFQLPTASPGAAREEFSFDRAPPGKIGQLVVYKSGKTVLRVGDVQYAASCESAVGRNTAMAQSAVALLQSPDGGMGDPCCYDLGPITKKVVCTPLVDLK